MTETMRAVVLTGHGGLDRLVYREDLPIPVPGPGEVLIRVLACGLNNTDVNTRTGWYSKGVTSGTTGAELETAEDDDAAWGGAPITFPRAIDRACDNDCGACVRSRLSWRKARSSGRWCFATTTDPA